MRVEDFRNKSEDELRQLADGCFARMEERGVQEEAAHLLRAQLYMNEMDRRHDATIVRRDFILELVIIGLILAEIVFGIAEGNKQATVLSQMSSSTAATAGALKEIQKAQEGSLEEQTKSLESLQQMNGNLHSSVRETSEMATALQKQLRILQDEQEARQAELAKKPHLELDAGVVPLNTAFITALKPREESETKITFDLVLKNLGDAVARNGTLRVIAFAKDVTLQCSSPFERIFEEPDSTTHVILVHFDFLRPENNIPMSITATYPKGQAPFSLAFNIDADEIPAATFLGGINIKPIKPLN